IGLRLHHILFHGRVQRPHGFAFAEDFHSDSLPNITLRAAIFDERFGRPTQHVDEARSNRQPLRVNMLSWATESHVDAQGLAVAPGFINMLSWATESAC